MPIFDYSCPACQDTFEELVSRADAVVHCPRCHTPATKRLSAFAAPVTAGSTGGDSCACYPTGGG